VSCRRARREILEHFRFRQELGPSSSAHLEHLVGCADCREEVGIDRALVEQLRRALQERVEGHAPSAAAWDQVRQRTIDRPSRPLGARVLQWGRLFPAAIAGVLMFAIATVSQEGLSQGSQSPQPAGQVQQLDTAAAVDDTPDWEPPWWMKYRTRPPVPTIAGGPMAAQLPDMLGTSADMPPVSGRLQ
jgi:hypothetical protein